MPGVPGDFYNVFPQERRNPENMTTRKGHRFDNNGQLRYPMGSSVILAFGERQRI